MNPATSRRTRLSVLLSLAMFGTYSAWAVDPPDSSINPVTEHIETVDILIQNGIQNIRHASNPGGDAPIVVTMVSTHNADESGARVSNTSNGDTWVVWWRDEATDSVWARQRVNTSNSWSSPSMVSEPGTGSRRPEIVSDGNDSWVAFEADAPGTGTTITVRSIRDDPEPIGALATTTFTGDIDIRMHMESSHFWITWVDDDCDVGWSEYDGSTESWSVAAYENCNADSVDDARGRVRSEVLGL